MKNSFSLYSFVGGFMLGALLIGAWFLGGNFTSTPAPSSSSSTVNTATATTSSESSAISVTDQPSGDTAVIESVTVPPPGVWIAVREMSGNDLGNVLGAVRVSGPRSSISVPLLRATVPNHSYAVELYRDDGNGAFDPASNSVYVDFTTGAPVIAYFTTAQ
ncbi:MAG: hypothetical protein ABSB00_00645 [Minisyncoccia bacterium]|jgi:hypothetical protein